MSDPLVSVITATYNRAEVLRSSMASVQWQTLSDWEHIVVGDACTDHTEEVVASFGDDRVRWVNLAENVGEQSGPNNEGMRLARGRYLAFLNHDDLYFPEHLERSVATLEETGADLVYPLILRPFRNGAYVPMPTSRDGRYHLHLLVPGTSWVFRRELVDTVGPWRYFREIRAVPARNWISRAYRLGADIRESRHVGLVKVPSQDESDQYRQTGGERNAAILAEMGEPDFLERVLFDNTRWRAWTMAAPPLGPIIGGLVRETAQWLRELVDGRGKRPEGAPPLGERVDGGVDRLRRATRLRVRSLLSRLGIDPVVAGNLLRRQRRGQDIDTAREIRGLPAVDQD